MKGLYLLHFLFPGLSTFGQPARRLDSLFAQQADE